LDFGPRDCNIRLNDRRKLICLQNTARVTVSSEKRKSYTPILYSIRKQQLKITIHVSQLPFEVLMYVSTGAGGQKGVTATRNARKLNDQSYPPIRPLRHDCTANLHTAQEEASSCPPEERRLLGCYAAWLLYEPTFRRRRYVPPKRRSLQEPRGVTSQKTPSFKSYIALTDWVL
jgi:hypothetical protein